MTELLVSGQARVTADRGPTYDALREESQLVVYVHVCGASEDGLLGDACAGRPPFLGAEAEEQTLRSLFLRTAFDYRDLDDGRRVR